MNEAAQVVKPSVRRFLDDLIGGKVLHVALFNDNTIENGISVVIRKGKNDYTLNIDLPKDTPFDDVVELNTWKGE